MEKHISECGTATFVSAQHILEAHVRSLYRDDHVVVMYFLRVSSSHFNKECGEKSQGYRAKYLQECKAWAQLERGRGSFYHKHFVDDGAIHMSGS